MLQDPHLAENYEDIQETIEMIKMQLEDSKKELEDLKKAHQPIDREPKPDGKPKPGDKPDGYDSGDSSDPDRDVFQERMEETAVAPELELLTHVVPQRKTVVSEDSPFNFKVPRTIYWGMLEEIPGCMFLYLIDKQLIPKCCIPRIHATFM